MKLLSLFVFLTLISFAGKSQSNTGIIDDSKLLFEYRFGPKQNDSILNSLLYKYVPTEFRKSIENPIDLYNFYNDSIGLVYEVLKLSELQKRISDEINKLDGKSEAALLEYIEKHIKKSDPEYGEFKNNVATSFGFLELLKTKYKELDSIREKGIIDVKPLQDRLDKLEKSEETVNNYLHYLTGIEVGDVLSMDKAREYYKNSFNKEAPKKLEEFLSYLIKEKEGMLEAITPLRDSIININAQNTNVWEECKKLEKDLAAKSKDLDERFAELYTGLKKKANTAFPLPHSFMTEYDAAFQIKDFDYLEANVPEENETHLTSSKNGISFDGLPNQTEIIDALSIYIANRFKEEISITLIDKIGKTMENNLTVSTLFPETTQMFLTLDPGEIPGFGAQWYSTISRDIESLPINLLKCDKINLNPETKELLALSFSLAKEVSKGKNIYDALQVVYDHFKSVVGLQKYTRQIFTYLHYSELILGNSPNLGVSIRKLKSLNNQEQKVLVDLFYHYHLSQINDFDLRNFSKKNIRKVVEDLSGVSRLIKELNDLANSEKPATDRLEDFFEASTNFFRLILDKCDFPNKENINDIISESFLLYKNIKSNKYPEAILGAVQLISLTTSPEISAQVLTFLKEESKTINTGLMSLNSDLNSRLNDPNLTSGTKTIIQKAKLYLDTAILYTAKFSTVEIIDMQLISLMKETANHLNATYADLKSLDLKNLKTEAIIQLVYFSKIATNDIAKKQFESLETITFFADAITANDSKELAEVIEAYASKNNSYKAKRFSPFTFSINAWPGMYAGVENKSFNLNSSSVWVSGFTCPVGFSFSRAWKRNTDMEAGFSDSKNHFITEKDGKYSYFHYKGGSISYHLNLLDLGAVVSYRFSNDSTEGLPKQITFDQIFAPGFQVYIGIRNTPLAFGLGGQMNPKLRNFDQDEFLEKAFRFNFGLYFDIPVYNAFVKQRNKISK